MWLSRSAPRARVRKSCAVGLLLVIVACERPDGAGVRQPAAPARSARVVSLSPLASDLLLAWGGAASLVAVDRESRSLPGLGGLPVVDLASAAALEPDLVLVSGLRSADEALADALRAGGSEVVRVEPHDFDEAFALCRSLGGALVGSARAEAFVNSLGTELAQISGASFGRARPRVAAVVSVSPFELAGGHSFATDLIEIAGGRSVTHEIEERRIPTTVGQLLDTAPDVVLVTSPLPPSPPERERAQALLGGASRLAFFAFDSERFWVRDAVEVARRLRALVEPISRALEQSAPPQGAGSGHRGGAAAGGFGSGTGAPPDTAG